MSKTLGVAVIGCGHWGPNHLRNFSAFPDTTVKLAVDLSAKSLERVAQMFPGMATSSDPKKAFSDKSVQAVVISTPTATHYDLVRAALDAGKHVLCEKPLCQSASEARALESLARKRGLILMVGHVFLFNAGVAKLKELLEAKELGKLHYLSSTRTNLGPIRSDVNAAYDLAAHDVSIFNWLLGAEPEWVSATGASFVQVGIEDVVFMTLKYPSGVFATVHASWLNPKKVRQMTIVGSKKMVTWDDLETTTPVAVYDRGAAVDFSYKDFGEFLRVQMWDGEVRLPKVPLEEPLKAQDRYFVDAVAAGSLGRSDGKFGSGVVKVLEAAARSVRKHGAPEAIK